jgi:hypothetical protein
MNADAPHRESFGSRQGSRTHCATKADGRPTFLTVAPSIDLPKGGSDIRGVGEEFGTNPLAITRSVPVTIATSPGHTGFGQPQGMSYDSHDSRCGTRTDPRVRLVEEEDPILVFGVVEQRGQVLLCYAEVIGDTHRQIDFDYVNVVTDLRPLTVFAGRREKDCLRIRE